MDSYKIIFLGNFGVGKTSIIKRMLNKNFDAYEPNTIGCAFNTYVDFYQ